MEMNRKVNGSILAGALLGAAAVSADILVDDFLQTNGTNKITGNWIADSDEYPAIGGSSRVFPVGDTSNLVLGEGCGAGCYAGHNIFKAYQEVGVQTVLQTELKVTADVGPAKKWAYAGWVMNFTKEWGRNGKQPWELLPHEKGNEVDISSCTHLRLQIGFDADRQLWIAMYNPHQELAAPAAPQYGWRYRGTGQMEIKNFNLAAGGLSGIATKWADATTPAFDPKKVTRLQIFYEGQKGLAPAEPAPYDAVNHTLTLGRVELVGANCKIIGKDSSGAAKEFGTVGIKRGFASKAGDLKVSAASGSLVFSDVASLGAAKVTVRSVTGEIVARGEVDAFRTSMDVSGLRNGVYMVEAANGAKTWSNAVTLLK
jgi:hypothetical protein